MKPRYKIPGPLPPQCTPQPVQGWIIESRFPESLRLPPAPNFSSGRNLKDCLVQCSLPTYKETETQRTELIAQVTWLVTLGEETADHGSHWSSSKPYEITAKGDHKQGRDFSFSSCVLALSLISWLQVDMCRFSKNSQTLGFLSVSLLEGVSLEYFQPQRN